MTTAQDLERFWSKVDTSGDCWLWTASFSAGYGQIYWGGRLRKAHRVVLEIFGRDVPAGGMAHHSCETRACVNPAHLEIVSGHREHGERHLVGCATHGELEMFRRKSGASAGQRYCRACARERMAIKRVTNTKLAA